MCNLGALILLGSLEAVNAGLGDTLGHVQHATLGDAGFGGGVMERTFQAYATLPVNAGELKEQGWVKMQTAKCDPYLGWEWTQGAQVTGDKPIVLYTTEGGQISGIGVQMMGDLPDAQKKWSQKKYSKGWQIDVAFRQGDIMCSGKISEAAIGDTLIVNPSGPQDGKMVVPLIEKEVDGQGWHRGSCFDGMGWHRYLDTAYRNGSMSWQAENVFPVVGMYSGGNINAINFITWNLQQGISGAHQWDPVPSPSFGLCYGMCDSHCKTFTGTHFFSTMHIYFRSHTAVKCEPNLKCEVGKSASGSGMLCCDPEGDALIHV